MSVSPFLWNAAEAALLCGALLAAERLTARMGFHRVRHALWLVVLVKVALPPVVTAPWAVTSGAGGRTAIGVVPGESPGVVPWPWIAAWAAGAGLVAWYAVRRELAFRRSVAEGRIEAAAPEAHVRRAARALGVAAPVVVVTRAVSTPALLGAIRPVLLLPADRDRSLRAALLHEMAHLRRRDPLVRAATVLLRVVFWFHPAAWIASARIAALREVCADLDACEALGRRAPAYRDAFVASVRRMLDGPGPTAAARAAIGWQGGVVAERLRALGGYRRRNRRERVAGVAAVLAAACVALPAQVRSPDLPSAAAARAVLADGPSVHGCLRTRLALLRLAAGDAGTTLE